MESITSDLSMDNLMAVVEYFQTLYGANGEVEEGKERHATIWHCIIVAILFTVGELVPVGPEIDQFLEEVGTGGLEYTADQLIVSSLCG